MKTRILFLLLIPVFLMSMVNAQSKNKKITISGTVADGTRTPVANALVMIDGEKTNKFTDEKGFYKVRVKSGTSKIGILTSTGMLEEQINGRTGINFNFEGSVPPQSPVRVKPGDEAVDIGYGSVKKRDLTGTVNKIDGTNPKYASYTNIYDMIRGEVPGVQVSGSSIKIQGAASFTLGTEPLFVVDGTVVSSIADILPITVKSIQVLKGSSAAIYGSRGANGVLVINLTGSGR